MGLVVKFCAGVLMTLLFVIAVPYVTSTYIMPLVTDIIGDNTFLVFSSQTVVEIVLFTVLIAFMMVLGGGAVLRWCGLAGVIGMIFAYWLLGDLTRAIIPLISLTVAYIITIPIRKRREEKAELKASRKA